MLAGPPAPLLVLLRVVEARRTPRGDGWPCPVPALLLLVLPSLRHYWLTTERLFWKPRLGEPVQVLLSSLGDGQVGVGFINSVKVRGRSPMSLRYVPNT